MDLRDIKRGDIYYVEMCNATGSEQTGNRPAVVIQNDRGNLHSGTTIVAFITSKENKRQLPTHVEITPSESGLPRYSTIMAEQICTVDKSRIKRWAGTLNEEVMAKVNKAIGISIGIIPTGESNGTTYRSVGYRPS
jgi:mRNA interferase MazF